MVMSRRLSDMSDGLALLTVMMQIEALAKRTESLTRDSEAIDAKIFVALNTCFIRRKKLLDLHVFTRFCLIILMIS